MKTIGYFGKLFLVLLLLGVMSLNAQARDHSSYGNGEFGRLIIKRSPALGYNVTITVYIDGRLAGAFVRGHTFHRYISPGRHVITARPNRLRGDWSGILDVRPGQTYAFVASCPPQHLVLDPIRASYHNGY